jgi:hypothetical protein
VSKKKSDRQASALAREAEQRMALFEFDARQEARAELDRRDRQRILAEAQQELARDRLEAEAEGLENYRATAVAQAVSSKSVAPQFVPFIDGTSREQIDASIERARAATAEIAAEISGQTTTTPAAERPRDVTGRFIAEPPGDQYLPAGMTADEYAKAQSGSLDMTTYVAMRDRLGLGHRDAGIFG